MPRLTALKILGGFITAFIGVFLILLLGPVVNAWLPQWEAFVSGTPLDQTRGAFNLWRWPAYLALLGLALAVLAAAWPKR